MSIRSIGNPYGPLRPAGPAPSAAPAAKPNAAGKSDASVTAPPRAPMRRDSVAISDAGRAMTGAPDAAGSTGRLSAERVTELRRKVLEGAYNQAGMVDQVARRLLSSGDV